MNATRMRKTEILIDPHVKVWSCQNDFSWMLFICTLPDNTILKFNSGHINVSFPIGYFERYVNSKSDSLELLLSVYPFHIFYIKSFSLHPILLINGMLDFISMGFTKL